MKKILLALALSGLTVSAFATGELRYFDLKAAPDAQMPSYVDVDGIDKLKGIKRVLIPQFRVEYQLRAESSAADHAYLGGGQHAGASSSAYVHLKGISDEELQKLTDRIYQTFVDDLTRHGIEVIGPDKLAALPEYEPILRVGKASGETLETKDSLSRFFAPQGGRVYSLLRRTDKDRQGFGSRFSTGFADLQKELPKAELALAKKFDAPCLKVLLTVSPARVKTSAVAAGGLIGAAINLIGSSADVRPGLTVTEESRLVFRSASHSENDFKMFGGKRFFGQKVRDFTEEGDAAIFLKQDVRVEEPISQKPMEETTSGYHKVSNALAPVLALTIGQGRSHVEYTIDADPALFTQVAGEELIAANRMLLGRFRQASDGIGSEPVKE